MNLFVFGLGYTARHFIAMYRERFVQIAGTCRSPEAAAARNAGVLALQFDEVESDPRILQHLHAAEFLLVSIPPVRGPDPVLARFAQAIASAPRLRWIGYLSTVGVYGDANGGWVDEASPLARGAGRSRHRIEAERQWLALGSDDCPAVQVFRLAGIYGPGRNALERVAEGTAQRIVKPGQVFNRIHVEDIARVLMASIERPQPNVIYNVADDAPSPPQDVIAYAAELLGRPVPPEIAFADADLTPMARSFYEDNKRVRNTRIKTDLGVKLRYPTYREGLRALAASGTWTVRTP